MNLIHIAFPLIVNLRDPKQHLNIFTRRLCNFVLTITTCNITFDET